MFVVKQSEVKALSLLGPLPPNAKLVTSLLSLSSSVKAHPSPLPTTILLSPLAQLCKVISPAIQTKRRPPVAQTLPETMIIPFLIVSVTVPETAAVSLYEELLPLVRFLGVVQTVPLKIVAIAVVLPISNAGEKVSAELTLLSL